MSGRRTTTRLCAVTGSSPERCGRGRTRRSRAPEQHIGVVLDRAIAETAEGSAQEAASELKESARDHARQVADQAKDAGQQMKETAISDK
jgi:hypothetical protein